MTEPLTDPHEWQQEFLRELQEVLSEALTAVNEIRQGLGREPLERLPVGFKGNPYSCPVANALKNGGSAGVSIAMSVYDEEGRLVYSDLTPPALSRFMTWFDNGVFPELER